jgi:hypothetical protein
MNHLHLVPLRPLLVFPVSADTFGGGDNQIEIDFVDIGNAGNVEAAPGNRARS